MLGNFAGTFERVYDAVHPFWGVAVFPVKELYTDATHLRHRALLVFPMANDDTKISI